MSGTQITINGGTPTFIFVKDEYAEALKRMPAGLTWGTTAKPRIRVVTSISKERWMKIKGGDMLLMKSGKWRKVKSGPGGPRSGSSIICLFKIRDSYHSGYNFTCYMYSDIAHNIVAIITPKQNVVQKKEAAPPAEKADEPQQEAARSEWGDWEIPCSESDIDIPKEEETHRREAGVQNNMEDTPT
jgi:hypothetical protein